MTYSEQLKSPLWQRKRLEVMKALGFKCQSCGDPLKTLNVHHKKYKAGRKAWEYELTDFSVLCNDCHKIAHSITETSRTQKQQNRQAYLTEIEDRTNRIANRNAAKKLKEEEDQKNRIANRIVNGKFREEESKSLRGVNGEYLTPEGLVEVSASGAIVKKYEFTVLILRAKNEQGRFVNVPASMFGIKSYTVEARAVESLLDGKLEYKWVPHNRGNDDLPRKPKRPLPVRQQPKRIPFSPGQFILDEEDNLVVTNNVKSIFLDWLNNGFKPIKHGSLIWFGGDGFKIQGQLPAVTDGRHVRGNTQSMSRLTS